jgi:hypothetical protein
MARMSHAPQIDLRCGDVAGALLSSRVGVRPGNFAREGLNLFGQYWIGLNRQA